MTALAPADGLATPLQLTARECSEPFPAKIYLAEPEVKKVFSSKWWVTAAGRELCFIAKVDGKISVRVIAN